MHSHSPDSKLGCGTCEECPMGKDLVGPISGWRMVMISAGLFVGPVVLATIGSVWAGESHIGQFLGGLLGLGLGLIISVLLGRHMK